MNILLIGKSGQVGFELHRSLSCIANVIATDRSDIDLTDNESITKFIHKAKPDIIVNAAAYTAVDKAETEQDLAYQINARAPEVMAEVALELNIPLIHYSTDYVYNGAGDKAWLETDKTDPVNFYGETKRFGEIAIEQSGCYYLIFRTSWVYDARGHNFLNTMLRLSETKDELSIIDDQVGAPTYSRHIADATANIISQSISDDTFWKKHKGIYHLVGEGEVTWYGFADAIFNLNKNLEGKKPKLNRIQTKEYPAPAKRPANSRLNTDKLYQHFKIKLPHWKQSLALVLAD
jgi:dTDP-4-dehydrorhamnose reductase